MTILTLNRKELEKALGKIDKEMQEKISMFGTPIEEVTQNEVSVEVFPNRPDLLSQQTFERALKDFLGYKTSKININKPLDNYEVKIHKSVKNVRPYTYCAIVKGLKLDDEKIKQIIDIQEKLHQSIGRKRKKLAIGIYPLEKIKLPIEYKALSPDDIKFQPLESTKELTAKQILRQHPAGKEYAHLLEDKELYPVFIDADNKILSMPPIINSQETGRINEKTKDLFIECSGFNQYYLKKTLNIILTAFNEMNGKIYSMNIKGNESYNSPDFKDEELKFKIENINKTLGLNLTEKEINTYLAKMGIQTKKEKNRDNLIALIPAYRTDILHWIDLTEEVAIAYGYDNFQEEIPKISTIAKESKQSKTRKLIGDVLSGLHLLETSSFHLINKKDIKKMHYDYKDFIEVEESKTEYNTLRIDLMSNLLKILAENSDSSYPQKIFETGVVFKLDREDKNKDTNKQEPIKESTNLAIALINENTNFTEIKQILDYLFRMLDIEYEIKPAENNNYIQGRVGEVIIKNKEDNENKEEVNIGYIGELAPRILKNWKLKFPIACCEINIDWLINKKD